MGPGSTFLRARGHPHPNQTVTHVVREGDVSAPCQQHADHLDVLVLCSPDDGCPPPTVLWVGREGGTKMGGSPCPDPGHPSSPAHQSSMWSTACTLEQTPSSTTHTLQDPGQLIISRRLDGSFLIFKMGLIVSITQGCGVIFLFLKNT